ncbi:hypothetical protein [Actinoplanes subglobosus]|uniref:CHAT domain-containing protein n=1 Tax=Actinoplanes subglobosus TaxID=1547892 RepID=A0ABV8IXN2_9ACTN
MELEVPRVWLRLTLDLQPDGQISVGAADSRGRVVVAPQPRRRAYGWETTMADVAGRPFAVPVRWPAVLPGWYEDLVNALPGTRTGLRLAPAVPVFVSGPRQLLTLPPEAVLDAVLGRDPGHRWILIEDRASGAESPPFDLPLVIVGVGDRGADVLRAAQESPWISDDHDLQPHLADLIWVDDATGVADLLARRDIDLLVLDAFDAAELAGAATARPTRQARVAIVLGSSGPPELMPPVGDTFPARSVFTVTGAPGDQDRLVTSLLRAVSHDLPLHDALGEIRNGSPAGIRLSASPDSLHDLRLSSAWAGIDEKAMTMSGFVGAGVVEPPGDLQPLTGDLVANLQEARRLEVDFARESHGLHVLAEARLRLGSAEQTLTALRQAAPAGRTDRPADRVRVVNLALKRRGEQVAPQGTGSVFVERVCSLAAGERYQLDVQVGANWPVSLVTGEQPAVDLLLPDDRDGHELHATVFSDTVDILGPAVVAMRLPPSGPSETVTFALATRAHGPAWARVGLYHRDHLLQTYRLEMLVEESERRHPVPVVHAVLQHSATWDWTNLDTLKPRALSLIVNHAPSGDHRLFVKSDDVAAAVPLRGQRAQAATDTMREILSDAVDERITSPVALWRIATQGRSLFQAIFNRVDPAVAEALRRMRAGKDLTIQIVRADVDEALPWTLVYDWPLPDHRYGQPPPPVCFGRTDDGQQCDHAPGDRQICVYGLWGIRHHVEELLADPRVADMPPSITITDPGALVALGVDDEATGSMLGRLSQLLNPRNVRRLGAEEHLLDNLFDPARPAVVIVLGHHETRDINDQPQGSRIALLSADGWLQPDRITDRRADDGEWQPPHSLVMLLSCRSAAAGPTELTSFLSALNGARAGAIVGTECDVYSDLAADFATTLLTAMNGPGPDGHPQAFAQAVRVARRNIVIDKEDIRGLAFDAFGPADLVFARR